VIDGAAGEDHVVGSPPPYPRPWKDEGTLLAGKGGASGRPCVIGRTPIIGLTGGIGSGKSLVAQMMGELGAVVLDADQTAHEVLADPEVAKVLTEWWGPSVVDPNGRVDRRRVGEIVFRDAAQRRRLEELIHPRIVARWEEVFRRCRGQETAPAAVVIDAPLLLEVGLDAMCDVIVFVEASDDRRMGRVRRSRGWSEDDLKRREKTQKSLDSKRAGADYILENNSGVHDLRRRVEEIFSAVTSLAT